MSLFRAKEWWSVKLGATTDEEFDGNCLSIGNVDNEIDESLSHKSSMKSNENNDNQQEGKETQILNKLVTGSFSGNLRIFKPSSSSYKVEDLMLEENLKKPILQTLVGRFVPGEEGLNGIAVLHPRELTGKFLLFFVLLMFDVFRSCLWIVDEWHVMCEMVFIYFKNTKMWETY